VNVQLERLVVKHHAIQHLVINAKVFLLFKK
jgi:hypothetical protein